MKINNKAIKATPKGAQLGASKMQRSIKAIATVVTSAANSVRSLFYIQCRNAALFTANLRGADFTAQVFESGHLQAPVMAIVTTGVQGVATSQAKVKMPFVDMGNGQLFDLTGIKQREVIALGKPLVTYAKAHGTAHRITLKVGPMKGTHEGYIIGSMEKMNVGFVTRDGQRVWTLDCRSLGKRNAHRTFVLES